MATIPWYEVKCVDCGHEYIRSLKDKDSRWWQDDFDADKPVCEKCGSENIRATKTWYIK